MLKPSLSYKVELTKSVVGGQTMANVTLPDGQIKKAFIWGGLPGEVVEFVLTKKRAGIFEGVVSQVLTSSKNRIEPKDSASYLSTSPWQIYDWDFENQEKAALTQAAFAQQQLIIPLPAIVTDNQQYNYRNKMEFTWWWDNGSSRLELANYRRGSKGKISVTGSSLAFEAINQAAGRIRDLLNNLGIEAYALKTLLIRSTQDHQIVAQLYVTDPDFELTQQNFNQLAIEGLEVIYSNPRSPASVITDQMQSFGDLTLTDQIAGQTFRYPAESFFQINLPVYELALQDIKSQIVANKPIVDFYSGVGTIGLSMAATAPVTMVEINEQAVKEMQRNIDNLELVNVQAILSPAEYALDYISADSQLIVDPPRVGLHSAVIDRILEVGPDKIIYLSCNPSTQARDLKALDPKYAISELKVYNFFPKTPHIESLAILIKR